jgi:hypothetical protein
VILRDGRTEVHYQVEGATLKSSARPCGNQQLGVDKGYTEVLTDSGGDRYGPGLGILLAAESDRLKVKNRRRAKIRAIAAKAAQRADHAKADRITRCNLGTAKKTRARRRFNASERRGSALVLVNAACTSQADPATGTLGVSSPLPTRGAESETSSNAQHRARNWKQ